MLVLLPVRFIVRVHLVPHRVEDAEGAGEAKAENPGEIPHGVAPSVHAVRLAHMIEGDPAAHHAEDPAGVEQDDR